MPEAIINEVIIKGERFPDLETKDKALILAIQELTSAINRASKLSVLVK